MAFAKKKHKSHTAAEAPDAKASESPATTEASTAPDAPSEADVTAPDLGQSAVLAAVDQSHAAMTGEANPPPSAADASPAPSVTPPVPAEAAPPAPPKIMTIDDMVKAKDPAPAGKPRRQAPRFRVVETMQVSLRGQIMTLEKGTVIDGSGYGQRDIKYLMDGGLKLEQLTD